MEWFLGDKVKTSTGRMDKEASNEKSQITAAALVGTAPRFGSSLVSEGGAFSLGLGAGMRRSPDSAHGRTVASPPANRLTSRRRSRDFSRTTMPTAHTVSRGVAGTHAGALDVTSRLPVVDQASVNTQRKRKRDRLDLKHMPLRGNLWFSRYHKHLDKERLRFASVEELVSRRSVSQDTLEQIERDIPRTYPDMEELSTDVFREKLVRVLTAIAEEYDGVGYVQGMNFIIAYLLIHCDRDEDKAFRIFQILMDAPLYDMKKVYCKGLPKLIEFSNKLEQLLEIRYPKLHRHFETIGLDSVFYTQNWIVTLFAYNSCFHALVEIWDAFFERGWEILYRLGVVMMADLRGELLNASFEECVKLLRKYEKDLPDDLCKRATEVVLTAREQEVINRLETASRLPKRNSSGRFTGRSLSSMTLSSQTESVNGAEFTTASALSGTLKDLS